MYVDAKHSIFKQWLLSVAEKNILKTRNHLAISKIAMIFLRLSKDLKRSPGLVAVILKHLKLARLYIVTWLRVHGYLWTLKTPAQTTCPLFGIYRNT